METVFSQVISSLPAITFIPSRKRKKTISLKVNRRAEVIVRFPARLSKRRLHAWIRSKDDWIQKQREKRRLAIDTKTPSWSAKDILQHRNNASVLAHQAVARYAKKMNVAPARIKVTRAAARWGSCSINNALCFSWRLAMLPQDLIDYIVVHELAHIAYKNHGRQFWAEVERILPDHAARRKWLRDNNLRYIFTTP